MRAAILRGPGKIRLVDKPELAPKPQQVQVAVSYVGICGSDLTRFDGRLPSPTPVVFGHEFSGRVHSLGEDVTGLAIGQSVTVAPLLNCGKCGYCLADKGYLCTERKRFGTDVDGALSDFIKRTS